MNYLILCDCAFLFICGVTPRPIAKRFFLHFFDLLFFTQLVVMKILLILSFFALLGLAHCVSFSVEPRKEECFYEKAEKGTSITIMFQVVSGGQLDIDLRV